MLVLIGQVIAVNQHSHTNTKDNLSNHTFPIIISVAYQVFIKKILNIIWQ